jgi:hypothetical protein
LLRLIRTFSRPLPCPRANRGVNVDEAALGSARLPWASVTHMHHIGRNRDADGDRRREPLRSVNVDNAGVQIVAGAGFRTRRGVLRLPTRVAALTVAQRTRFAMSRCRAARRQNGWPANAMTSDTGVSSGTCTGCCWLNTLCASALLVALRAAWGLLHVPLGAYPSCRMGLFSGWLMHDAQASPPPSRGGAHPHMIAPLMRVMMCTARVASQC